MLLLLEGPVKGHITGIEEEKKPHTWQDLNPRPLCCEACTLPLCYIRCPAGRSVLALALKVCFLLFLGYANSIYVLPLAAELRPFFISGILFLSVLKSNKLDQQRGKDLKVHGRQSTEGAFALHTQQH